MPKESDRRELTREEIEQKQKEKFNTFFTTSVAQVPEEMINPTRSSDQPDRKHGLLARFFGKKEKASGTPPQEPEQQDDTFWSDTPIAPAPTGEIVLDGSAPGTPPEPGPSLEELTLELEGGEEASPAPRQEEPAPRPPRLSRRPSPPSRKPAWKLPSWRPNWNSPGPPPQKSPRPGGRQPDRPPMRPMPPRPLPGKQPPLRHRVPRRPRRPQQQRNPR